MSILSIFGIVDKGLALVNKFVDMYKERQLRNEGAKEQRLTDTKGVLDNVQKANAASDDPDIAKRVRDKYER